MGEDTSAIDRLRALFGKSTTEPEYAPVGAEALSEDEDVRRPVFVLPEADEGEPFSWFEYSIFLLLGIAMLWAW